MMAVTLQLKGSQLSNVFLVISKENAHRFPQTAAGFLGRRGNLRLPGILAARSEIVRSGFGKTEPKARALLWQRSTADGTTPALHGNTAEIQSETCFASTFLAF